MVTQDGAQGHHPGASGEEQERPAERLLPDEVAADGAAHLQLVPEPKLVDEVRRDLTVVQTLDGKHDVVVFRCGGDGVAPLRLVAVLSSQPHVDMLAGPMAGPLRQLERDALRTVGFSDELDHAAQLPGQSPR
jgi:hypothetical protein